MKFQECDVEGAWVVAPSPHTDDRGRFMRAWCSEEFADHKVEFLPVQANMAKSNQKGTLRGLHAQVAPAAEAKLVRCTRGSVFDVVADLRPESPTYLRWYGTTLSSAEGQMLYLPAGCAHGCLSLEDDSEIYYLTSAFYTPDCVRGARFDDPTLNIQWPMTVSIVSEQDRSWPLIDAQINE
jgi:dTDP-4-dehydrorhamnose 3,5-epimerase